jgi:hypothetical protein
VGRAIFKLLEETVPHMQRLLFRFSPKGVRTIQVKVLQSKLQKIWRYVEAEVGMGENEFYFLKVLHS